MYDAPSSFHLLLPMVMVSVIWTALVFDLRQRRIPNFLLLGGLVIGFTLQSVLGGATGALMALAGSAAGVLLLLPGFILRATGAGDVKLMAVAGIFFGPYWVLVAAIISILAGSLVAAAFAASALISRTSSAPWTRYGLMVKELTTTGRVSYAPPRKTRSWAGSFPSRSPSPSAPR